MVSGQPCASPNPPSQCRVVIGTIVDFDASGGDPKPTEGRFQFSNPLQDKSMETGSTRAAAVGRYHLIKLIRTVSSGDNKAFSELHALTINKMRKTALSFSSPSSDIEDVLQEAYLKIWRHASRFDPDRASPISWMSVIVRNTAIDAVRPMRVPTTDLDDAAFVADSSRQDDDDFDYARAGPIAAEIIGRLPEDRRRLLSLAYL
ncbi:MAG: RNA polymerase sigma factor, partial [Bradyrhizobium sp.]